MANKKTTGLASIAEGRSDVWKIDPRKINIKPNWNSRDFNDPTNVAWVDEIAQSACQIGIKRALIIQWENGKAWLVDGECRLRAAMRAIEHYKTDIKTVPVITEDRYANDADRLFNQYIYNTGKQFSDIELSNHFKRLLGLGWQAKDIALKAGLSAARVSQILNLQRLPEGQKAMISAGQVSAGLAVAMTKEHGGTEAEKILKQGLETAKAEGDNKVLPKHLGEAAPKATSNIKKLVQEAFEYSDFDDETDPEMTIIKMPREWWLKFRDICKL